jgi:hypothetical protein
MEDKMKKRMWYGTQVVEWTDGEMIARRYDVVDVREILEKQKLAAMVEEKPIPAEMMDKFNAAWEKCGRVTV